MRFIIKLLLLTAIAALVAPMFIQGTDGKPLLQLSDLLPQLPAVTEKSGTADTSRPAKTTSASKVYRWQDAQGQWHYSDTPPAHTRSESVTLKPVNTVPATPLSSSGNKPANQGSDSGTQPSPGSLRLPEALQDSDTARLIKQAQDTQRIIQERQAEIDALMQNNR